MGRRVKAAAIAVDANPKKNPISVSYRLNVPFGPVAALRGGPRHAQNRAVDSPIAATRIPATPKADA
jgi:hypothetical protein